MDTKDRLVLQEMKGKIDGIEKLALELKALGQGVPAIEKNVRSILAFTHALQFGVSDIVDVERAQGGH